MAQSSSSWIAAYNAAMTHGPEGPKKVAGVGCCPICCTFFSIFGALFLFVLAGLMNGDYKYLHIPGDVPQLSGSVTYAGLGYLACAVIAVGFWIRAARRTGQLSRTNFTQLQ